MDGLVGRGGVSVWGGGRVWTGVRTLDRKAPKRKFLTAIALQAAIRLEAAFAYPSPLDVTYGIQSC